MEHEHALESEFHRENGKRKNNLERKAEHQIQVDLAHDLWAEYDSADVKGRHTEVHKEIGQIMQQRLELPKPIPAPTVRRYLTEKKTAHG
jgi:hypothetical protein